MDDDSLSPFAEFFVRLQLEHGLSDEVALKVLRAAGDAFRRLQTDFNEQAARETAGLATSFLASCLAELSARDAKMVNALARQRASTAEEHARIALAYLQTRGMQWKPRLEVLIALLGDEEEKQLALQRLAGRFNTGRPRAEDRWVKAKEAWIAARREGMALKAAAAAATEASGLGRTVIYGRAAKERWAEEI